MDSLVEVHEPDRGAPLVAIDEWRQGGAQKEARLAAGKVIMNQ